MDRIVTIEKAIGAIRAAAEEIPHKAEDFLSYSTILDVHLSYAVEFFSPNEQHQLLEALAEILDTHEELARDISWDLVSVLLPFLESPSQTTHQTAESLIASAATKGNPREVFIKVLESLSSLTWAPQSSHKGKEGDDDDDDEGEGEGEDKAAYSGGEDEEKVAPGEDGEEDTQTHKHSLKKFHALLSALSIVHPRIAAKFTSRFLSTELTTLLGVFMKSVQWLEREEVDGVLRAILEFVELAKPKLRQPREQSLAGGDRPPLPPRVSTGGSTASLSGTSVEEGTSEELLQARLLQSFLSYILEVYLLRTRTRYNQTSVNYSEKTHEHTNPHPAGDAEDEDLRGLVLGWAGVYDEEVVRKGKSKVPGGQTLIDDERAARAGRRDVKRIVGDIVALSKGLGLETNELLKVCETIEEPNENADEGENTDIPAPASAEDVSLSKVGSLFLLAERVSNISLCLLEIFPDHQKISRNFLVLGPGQSQPPVVDAVLFLGALALHGGGGLGDIPIAVEDFSMYLQTFAAISATATSPQFRFLANSHVATCLKKHPDEAVRLAYIKDTLQHCPFESLKERVVVILKDEIIQATSPLSAGDSTPPTPNSIFGSPLALQELFPVLFPNVGELLSGSDDQNWAAFKNTYPTLVSTANLYYFLLKSPHTQSRMGVCDKEYTEKIDARFLAPLAKAVEGFKAREKTEDTDGMEFELDILADVLERVAETKKSIPQ